LKTLSTIRGFEIRSDRSDQLVGLRIVPDLGNRAGIGETFFQHAPERLGSAADTATPLDMTLSIRKLPILPA
jgi:hypothetical protein